MNSTVVVALIVIGAVVLVVSALVLITRKQTREHLAAMRAGYRALLAKHELAPSEEQEMPHRILGLDTRRRVFVVYNPASDSGHAVVPLSDVIDCSVRKEGVTLHTGRRAGKAVTQEHINSISLLLRLRDGAAVDVPVWSEVLDGLEEKVSMHRSAMTWQGRIKGLLIGSKSAGSVQMAVG